jgi:hypothetical protein
MNMRTILAIYGSRNSHFLAIFGLRNCTIPVIFGSRLWVQKSPKGAVSGARNCRHMAISESFLKRSVCFFHLDLENIKVFYFVFI